VAIRAGKAMYCMRAAVVDRCTGTSRSSDFAALIISRFGKMPQGAVAAQIRQTADPQACPTIFPPGFSGFDYLRDFPGTQSGRTQSCQGGIGHNSWYGDGQVNALSAVTH